MNYKSQIKLLNKLIKSNIKVKEFILEWQKTFIETQNYNRSVSVGWIFISDYVIRNYKL